MAIIEDQLEQLKKAVIQGDVKNLEQTLRIQKLLKKGIIRDNLFMSVIAVIAAIVVLVLISIFLDAGATTRNEKLLLLGFFICIMGSIIFLVNLVKNIKLVKSKNYKCYIGKISKINYEKYSVANIEDIQYLPGAKPSKNIQINDKIIIVHIGEDLYVLAHESSLKKE